MISPRVSLTIEESALKAFGTTEQAFLVNRSVGCAELDEFNYVELIYCKIWQSLLQTGARVTY